MTYSNMLSLKHTSNSLFSIPGFFTGFGNKCSSDSDSVRSPPSPLDFRVLYNLSNPFSLKSGRPSSQNGNQTKWDCSIEGLGIVNSLSDETKATSEIIGSPKRKNIIFGSQVKTNVSNSSKIYYDSDDCPIKSKSLNRNYITLDPEHQADQVNGFFGSVGRPLESEPSENIASFLLNSSGSSQSGSMYDPNLRFKSLDSVDKTLSSSLVLGRSFQVENSVGFKPSSLPVPIASTHQYASSISAREIELSEDYTCIISHGPKPKTTHIFGDCILECHTNELNNFDEAKLWIESPRVAKYQDRLANEHWDEALRFCYTCKKNLEGEEMYMCRGEKAFCSFDCHSEKIFAEGEIESTCDNSAGSSSESYHEDLFLLGMHCEDIE